MQGLVLVLVPGVMLFMLAVTLVIWALCPACRLPEWATLLQPLPWFICSILLELSVGWVVLPTLVVAGLSTLAYMGVRRKRKALSSEGVERQAVRRFRVAVLATAGLVLFLGCSALWSLA